MDRECQYFVSDTSSLYEGMTYGHMIWQQILNVETGEETKRADIENFNQIVQCFIILVM